MCFFSSLLGLTKKIVISWKNIKKLEKEAERGIRVSKDNGESVLFNGFSERDTSLKYIKRLWSRNSPHADQFDTDDDEEDEEADKLLN